MTRSLVVAAAVFVTLNLWAGGQWEKSYKNWDAKDIGKILNDSPWSRPVEIERKKKPSLEAPEGAPKVVGTREEDEEDEKEEKDDDDRNEKATKAKKADAIKFLVRWVSSRTLREASVRGQILQGKLAEADADKYLPPPAEDYELALVGTDMTSFRSVDESTLRGKTYLIAKKSKEKIVPSQVEIVRGSDGKRINAIVFHFPKKSASGPAFISEGEKEIQFDSRAGTIEIRVSFDPQKMVDLQGSDL